MDEKNNQAQEAPQFHVDENVIKAKIEQIKGEQNLGKGIIGGLVGGLIGAVLWSVVTYLTGYQIGFMAIVVGFLVGLGIRIKGNGIDRVFGIAGGVIAFLSVALGNFLVSLGFLAKFMEMGYFEIMLRFNYSLTFTFMREMFTFMDVVFYAIAIYAGYRFSFRKVSKEELLEGAVRPADPK